MRVSHLLPVLATATAVAASQDSQLADRSELMTLEQRGIVDDIWNKIKTGTTCAGCQGILLLLKGVAVFGDGAFTGAAKTLCKLAKVQDDDVCEGLLNLEGPAVARVIRDLSLYSRSAETFCGVLFGLCDIPKADPLNIVFPSEKPTVSRPRTSGKKPLKIVHFSDIHIDQHYTVGSNTQCNKPICCRAYTKDDAPGTTKNPAGPFGDHKCDTPIDLEQSMYSAIKELVPDAAFSVFTGDIVDHTIWNTSQAANTHDINDAMTIMDSHLNIVYGTVGNHEMSPVNLIPSNKYGKNAQWVYEVLVKYWTKWTGEVTANDITSIGAYAAKYPYGKLRVISLNTNLYYRHNFEVYRSEMEKDPNGQLTWLVQQLDAAEKAGDRAYIIGHMPMGDIDALHDGSHTFDTIVNRYSDTVAALFWGHTHVDHFELHYSDYSKREYQTARAMAYISPSLTPTSGMPSFRVYEVDPETFAVLDSVQYAADMSNPAFQTSGPVWTKYYSAKEAYGGLVSPPLTDPAAELTPAFWHNVTVALEASAAEFDKYLARKSRGWNPQTCAGDCQKDEICQLRGGRAEDNCYKPKPGLNFSKRDLIGNNVHDDCGASTSGMVLSRLATDKDLLDKLQEIFDDLGKQAGATYFDPEKGWQYD
ncbi:hypothetical protein PWT90_07389 [Aphanocladium album]|nr:hypothetical protein PWT90_07389 [Aphanocladium album]